MAEGHPGEIGVGFMEGVPSREGPSVATKEVLVVKNRPLGYACCPRGVAYKDWGVPGWNIPQDMHICSPSIPDTDM